VQVQHRVEGVDHEHADPLLTDLGDDVVERIPGEPLRRVEEPEAAVDDVVGDAERPQPRQQLGRPHRVQVGPGDRVPGVHLGLREDQRRPRLQRLGLARDQRPVEPRLEEGSERKLIGAEAANA